MTDKVPQIRVCIDPMLHLALQDMKSAARLNSGRRKPTLQSLIEARLIKLHRAQGLGTIVNPSQSFPMVFAPPSRRDDGSISFALRIHDQQVYGSILDLSEATSRPTAHILYSLLRFIVTSSESQAAARQISA